MHLCFLLGPRLVFTPSSRLGMPFAGEMIPQIGVFQGTRGPAGMAAALAIAVRQHIFDGDMTIIGIPVAGAVETFAGNAASAH